MKLSKERIRRIIMSETKNQSQKNFGSNDFRRQQIRQLVQECGLDLEKEEEILEPLPMDLGSMDLDLGMAMEPEVIEINLEDMPEESVLDIGLDDFVDADLGGQMLDSEDMDAGDGRSVKADLFRVGQLSQSLSDKLNDQDELPAWVIAKVATILDRTESVFDYLDYKIRVDETRTPPPLSSILFEQEEKKDEKEEGGGEEDEQSKSEAKEELLTFANKGLQEVPANQVDALMDQFKGLVQMAIDKKLAAKEEKLEKKMDQESGEK